VVSGGFWSVPLGIPWVKAALSIPAQQGHPHLFPDLLEADPSPRPGAALATLRPNEVTLGHPLEAPILPSGKVQS
jgi:hypothetical protein